MNAQKENLKKLPGSHKLPQAYEKCAMKMKVELLEEKNDTCVKIFLMELQRREFIGHLWKSSMIDRKEPQVDDC